MDTSRLKKFATEARTNLIRGVVDRLKTLGFDENGRVDEADRPEKLQGGVLFRGKPKQGYGFYNKWIALENAIKNHPQGAKAGVKHVAEEAAYTWFNRFVAIRILQKNGLIEPQLAYAEGGRIPLIVENARQGRLPQMDAAESAELEKLLDDDSKVLEQFAVLIVAYCHATPILAKCFGHIDDYSELLLPNNILAAGGFVDLLNTTDYITEEDFKQTELIGWLYQFYISEKKDEVFASFKNKKKAEAEDIPAATQIFTPNWIVKYMVQNTLGRIYLDNNKGSDLSKDWKYLVENSGNSGEIYKYTDLESLKVADFACGSGHILNEFFDMLYSFYMEDAYSSSDAIESIFNNNMIGIDLDTRAKQLSMFSLLLKACQKNKKFVDAKVLPRVYDMPDPITDKDWLKNTLPHYFLGGSDRVIKESLEALELMKSAKNLGSTMVFKISTETRNAIAEHIDIWDDKEDEQLQNLVKSFQIILALTDKYSAIAMNPPYMESGKVNGALKMFLSCNYPDSWLDLFSVFMDIASSRLDENAKYGMITTHSWMFLSSFAEMRNKIFGSACIESMLHLGTHTFDELGGEVVQNTAFIISNEKSHNTGVYFRLVSGKNCDDKRRLFLSSQSDKNKEIFYPNISQDKFINIPSNPIGYWLSDRWNDIFRNKHVSDIATPKAGVVTGDDKFFIKYWFEVINQEIDRNPIVSNAYSKYHFFYKGGGLRKYYGNAEYVIRLKDFWDPTFFNNSIRRGDADCYFRKGIGWSQVGSGEVKSFRVVEKAVCGTATPTIYLTDSEDYNYVLGLLNTRFIGDLLKLYNPTMNLLSSNICDVPYIENVDRKNVVSKFVVDNIKLSKSDWDAHETSWDFQTNELLAVDSDVPHSLASRMAAYENKWHEAFFKLHSNEEELNRQFIEIYGLQDELTPDVPLDEVTILQQGEISVGKHATCNMSCNEPLVDYNDIEFNRDVIIKQFISYAVGCMMGRYRLDKPGLAIAHPNATAEERAPYAYNGETWQIDDDGILPLMSKESSFTDNAVNRFTEFLRVALGSESLTENLNFVETCLGKSIEDYFAKDFWNDHKKMYQNRPIYWLFSSKKGAFKVACYMHRMDAYTAELVRKNYLLNHLDYLKTRISGLEADEASLSSADRKTLKKLRDNYDECLEYDGRLQRVAAQQISFDLDDGVVVNYAKFGDVLAKIK